MKTVVTIGEILVEIMATTVGDGFGAPIPLIGPFPSGAPAIFIDQVAKLGQPCGIVSCVGRDAFGRLNLDRLAADGVDVSAVGVDPDRPTGSAFVRYRSDGSRDFVFNIAHSACASVGMTVEAEALIARADHLHVMGSSLVAENLRAIVWAALDAIKARGGTVSFDPNLRPEVMGAPDVRAALDSTLSRTDVFLPSGEELFLFSRASDESDAIRELLGRGPRAIVLKRGAAGASLLRWRCTRHGRRLRGRGARSDGGWRLFRRDLCHLLAAWPAARRGTAPGLRERRARRHAAGPDGGDVDSGGNRCTPRRGPAMMAPVLRLLDLPRRYAAGEQIGITSVCSAHPLVIEAALLHGKAAGAPVLIEATCNQVNQEGGYTGMTPAGFRRFVEGIAAEVGFDPGALILGGDHLGPNPWRHLPAPVALDRAATMVRDYVEAGFTKIHLDTSMGCQGEDAALTDAVTAARAAMLAGAAEQAAASARERPVYVIGTEVPVPGGAKEALDHLHITEADAVVATVEAHRAAFAAQGIEAAFDRVIAVVVQPGVEFGNDAVVPYRPERASALSASLAALPRFVFEAHSTDYQQPHALAALVRDGFAILKVGPALTFALREVLYGLDHIAVALGLQDDLRLQAALEGLMLADPKHWQPYCAGTAPEQRILRHFGYSDRIRYYWPEQAASDAVDRLFSLFRGQSIPAPLVSQYLGTLHPQVAADQVAAEPKALIIAAVQQVLTPYATASRGLS